MSSGPELHETISFYRGIIRALVTKTFTEYSGPPKAWTSKLAGDATRKNELRPPWSKGATMDELDDHLSDVKRLVIGGTWEVEHEAWDIDELESESDGDMDVDGLDHKHGIDHKGNSLFIDFRQHETSQPMR